MQGYRTVIALLVQFVVSMGYLSRTEGDAAVEAIYGLLIAVSTLVGIYYKVQANRREKKLKDALNQ